VNGVWICPFLDTVLCEGFQRIVSFVRGRKFLWFSGECLDVEAFIRLKRFNSNIDEKDIFRKNTVNSFS